MRIFITGGSGFIGQRIVNFLLENGDTPIVFSRNPRLTHEQIQAGAQKVTGDIRIFSDLLHFLSSNPVDSIIHLASILKTQSESNPLLAQQVNVMGGSYVFEAARLSRIPRIVVCSSIATYATANDYGERWINEDEDRMKPASIYGATKLLNEFIASRFEQFYGMEMPILRISAVYGPGRKDQGVTAWIDQMIHAAIQNEPMTIPLPPDQQSSYIFVDDVAKQLIFLAKEKHLHDRIYNSGGHPGTPADITAIVRNTYPNLKVAYDRQRPKRPLLHQIDGTRLEQEMGFRIHTLEEGVTEHIQQTLKMSHAGR